MNRTLKEPMTNIYGKNNDLVATSILDVADAAYHTAHSYPGGVPALAVRMNMSQNTLAHKVSTSKDTHHLTLKEAMMMQDLSGDCRILHSMASSLGYVALEMSHECGPSTLQELSQMVKEFGESIISMQEAVSDGVVTPNEMTKCEKEAAELVASINSALRSVRSLVPKRA